MKKELTVPIRKDRKPLQDLLPLKQPLRIEIDPCDACNFKCKFCFQSLAPDFKGMIMSEELFEEIILQLKDFEEPINVVHLFGLGEPLINSNIAFWTKRLKEENVAKEVSITTNGSLLKPELGLSLINAGLDRINISLNGLSSDDFYKVANVKVDFAEYYSNIQFFYKNRKQCHVHIKICGDYFNETEKERFIELFSECADTINIDYVANNWPGLKIADDETKMYEMGNLLDFNSKPICAEFFYQIMIHPNGDVSPCDVDWKYKEGNLGNIRQMRIKDIWNSKMRNEGMINFLSGKEIPYKICNNCDYPKCGQTVNLEPYKDQLITKYMKEK